MKPALILLIALACYYSSVSSELCPSVHNSMTAFLSGTEADLKKELKKHVRRVRFGIANAVRVQDCIQEDFTEKEKEGLYDVVKKVISKCSDSN